MWDGTRWAPDAGGEVRRRAKEVVRAIYAEAAAAEDPRERAAIVAHAQRSESRKGIEAMVDLAAMFVPVAPGQLDADPWLLNVTNGTVDLRSGALRQHRRDDLLTKIAPWNFDLEAEAPLWEAFLGRILPDPEVRAFVQRAAGYSITGVVRDHVLIIAHGSGSNGKSTFAGVLLRVLGDYGRKARQDLLMAGSRGSGSANPDVARLRGVRFVAAIETEDNRRLAEVTVKEITGGDRIAARLLYQNPTEFDPSHTTWLATNHRPEIRGTDVAVWRRIRLVPFDVQIPEAEQERDLADKIVEREAAGVLAWAVRACLAWQEQGLAAPDKVIDATREYRAEQDVLAAFIEDRCVEGERSWVKTKDLNAAYRAWCAQNGEEPLSRQAMGRRLRERGHVPGHDSTGAARIWTGISLAASDVTDVSDGF